MPSELNAGRTGFWAGMPKRLRTRFFFLAVYYPIAGYVAAIGHWLGIALLAAPALWWLFRVWLLDEVLGVVSAGRPGLVGPEVEDVARAHPAPPRFAGGIGAFGELQPGLDLVDPAGPDEHPGEHHRQ